MTFTINLDKLHNRPYVAFAFGLIDIIKHELHANEGNSITLRRFRSLSSDFELAEIDKKIPDFDFKNPDWELVQQLESGLLNLLKKNKTNQLHREINELNSIKMEVNFPCPLQQNDLFDPPQKIPAEDRTLSPNYRNMLTLEVQEDHKQQILNLNCYQFIVSIILRLFSGEKTEDTQLHEWYNSQKSIHNAMNRVLNVLGWLSHKNQDNMRKLKNIINQSDSDTETLKEWIESQLVTAFYDSILMDSTTIEVIREAFSKTISIPKEPKTDILKLANLLHINLEIHYTNNTLISNQEIPKGPQIKLDYSNGKDWKTNIETNHKNISKFNQYFSDSIISKKEIRSIFLAYKNKSLAFFVNHHVKLANEIILMCNDPSNEIVDICKKLGRYLDDRNNVWTKNSHFKDAAKYILSRSSYCNGYDEKIINGIIDSTSR